MIESRDPTIKLFGMNIPFPEVIKEANSAAKVNPNNYSLQTSHDSKPETIDIEETTSTDQIESNGKNLKKPTKIQPCPRCKSMDTKFCYYNNYNINQPRHFCKACQRYWTAGGTMRNVPVGAGRRKNKNSSSHYSHITISEATRFDPSLQANTRILSFGLEAHKQHELSNRDDCSSGSSVTTSNNHSVDKLEPQMNNMNGYPCISGFPWPYMWNPAMPPSGFYPSGGIPGFSGYPMPFCPYWPIPMLSPHQSSSPMSQKGSNPNPSTLGKHSRDEENARKDSKNERKQRNGCVLVPKMLRIDDPNEAAKSSIWTTLGIKDDGTSKVGLFEGFHQKTKNDNKANNSSLLSANPAALSRSLNFHERI